jgi:hypothetical protein
MRRPTTGEDYPVGVIPHAIRKAIATRGSNLRVTSEFGRRYKDKDVEKYKGSYTMEDWLHFIFNSPYLLCPYGLGWEGPKAKIFQEMWQYLVDAAHHYFHGMQEYSDDKSKKTAENLYKFAVLAEEHLPRRAVTYNLHVLVCR